jgi:hypothetical protein
MVLYCVAIFAVLDVAYSRLFYERDRFGRVANEYYHHGFLPNFEGYESWGHLRERLYTNSLGFKDGRIRDVPATTDTQRIILIGDSITEGIGLAFEDTFAGLLYGAGQQRSPKIEFLNAASTSYSPVIYYKKIKYLLDAGLRFDEVVVFSDLSDVQDEATSYFCIDDQPEYRRFCQFPPGPPSAPPSLSPPGQEARLPYSRPDDYFVVTLRAAKLITNEFDVRTGRSRQLIPRNGAFINTRSGWTLPGFDAGIAYDPLGVEGGIKRSMANMQALADLLRSRGIGLTIVVYPWPLQLLKGDLRSRQVELWRDFCGRHCKRFIDLFPPVFAERDAREDWYEHLFIPGDIHYSVAGNRVIFRALAQHLL